MSTCTNGRINHRLEAVDLASFNDKDVSRPASNVLPLTVTLPQPSRMNWISS